MDDPTVFLLSWAVIGGAVGAIIGNRNGRGRDGFCWGLLLGPIGWLIVGLGPDLKQQRESKKCPFCAELIKKEALVCRYCGGNIIDQSDSPLQATEKRLGELSELRTNNLITEEYQQRRTAILNDQET